jgi:hypothetical protein
MPSLSDSCAPLRIRHECGGLSPHRLSLFGASALGPSSVLIASLVGLFCSVGIHALEWLVRTAAAFSNAPPSDLHQRFFGADPICGAVSCQTEGNVPR